jgi:hypothetical protein
MNLSKEVFMKGYIFLVVVVALVLFFLIEGIPALQDISKASSFVDGQEVTAKAGSSAYQCPGGEGADDSRFQRHEFCQNQYVVTVFDTATEVEVSENEFGTKSSGGWVRILCPNGRNAWISARDIQ